jgi:hypothetical protein
MTNEVSTAFIYVEYNFLFSWIPLHLY